MSNSELPDSKGARVDWVIRAPTNAEMRKRYDVWAAQYDADIGSFEDYLAPIETAKVARDYLDPQSRIMDAGAGTGLVGEALANEGFSNLVAIDYSERMLDIARGKGLYAEIHQCDLNQPTAFDDNAFDGVVSCGTTTQMPSVSLREFVRLVRPGGRIVFAVVLEGWEDKGWAGILSDLASAGRASVIHKGPPFQPMPTTEPQFSCEVWAIEIA